MELRRRAPWMVAQLKFTMHCRCPQVTLRNSVAATSRVALILASLDRDLGVGHRKILGTRALKEFRPLALLSDLRKLSVHLWMLSLLPILLLRSFQSAFFAPT